MKYRKILYYIILSLSLPVYANMNDDIWELSQQSKEIIKSINIKEYKNTKVVSDVTKPLLADIDRYQQSLNPKKQQGGKVADGAILFVSFTMPNTLIKELSDEAHSFNIPVVIKGLINEDFKQTIEKIGMLKLEMEKEQKKFSGILIDPVWFDRFSIDKVPALVVTKRPNGCFSQEKCPDQKYDVVYGNTSIKNGLEIISQKGNDSSTFAKTLLGRTSNE
jgi:conjugal transfer pilus assembly protein TrbC